MNRVERIRELLQQGFSPVSCVVEDESALHAGHAGAASGGGHFRVHIVADAFAGKNRLARHRLVYDCLHDLMQADIHALAIVALAPSELSDEAG